ncbi:hypothetical protein CEP51_016866 [Fusarium floridanum]|uniref:Uncharacterized protein n=2 Tax=Fusarium solani species complex TaxID=232080 RepID=A0A428NDQ5_9HYPO|nr:hypothetical protein CEP51_016866 [Fusarium floridanum]RSM01706.1 hypothetical protein CDV31_011229 [Fusarium ambrosium]
MVSTFSRCADRTEKVDISLINDTTRQHHITSQRIVRQRTYTLSTGHFAASTAAAIIIIIIPNLLSFSFRSRGLVPSDLTRYRLFRWRQPV